MNIFKSISFLFSFFLIPLTVQANHHKINSLQDIEPLLRDVQKSDLPDAGLIVFDVDMTLTVNTNPALHLKTFKENKAFLKRLKQSVSPDQWAFFLNSLVTEASNLLIENDSPSLVRGLQEKGYKTLALTALYSGSFKKITSLEQWRYQELKKLGLDFSLSFPDQDSFSIDSIQPYLGKVPVFYKGVVCANISGDKSIRKAHVLTAFLKQTHFSPAYILCIDDRAEELEAFKKVLAQAFPKTRFLGLHYVGGLKASRNKKISSQDFEKIMASSMMKSHILFQKLSQKERGSRDARS